MLKQAGRRLVVSPWFAAGAGVVIATGAVIYMPHADMSYGGAISVTHCKVAECSHVTPNDAVPLQLGSGQQVTVSPSPPSVLAGMTFSYQVLDQSSWDGFSMLITIRAPHSLGQWKLAFAIPGATGVYVLGARWAQSGPDGGTASNYYGSTESAGDAAIAGNQSGAGSGSGQDSRTVQFQIRGTGTPSAPADCSYNGAACQFQRSGAQTVGNWPGSG
jgi:hypothetical protein